MYMQIDFDLILCIVEKQTLLSPVIMCGPQDTTFNKSLILSFDHCASLKLGQWKLSIYSSNSSYNEPPKWEVRHVLLFIHDKFLPFYYGSLGEILCGHYVKKTITESFPVLLHC